MSDRDEHAMTTQTLTLTDFLSARIAKDEAWLNENPHFADAPGWVPPWWTRVVAECEVKRRLVQLHTSDPAHECPAGADAYGVFVEYERDCRTLKLLALPYADHEHYRDEWRP